MAEYAGLEIRIGGNTTSLNNALKASTKSAAELQSQIRQATKAMQFDPTNLGNVDTRIRVTGDRMQSLQSKVQILRTAMEQLGGTMVSFGGGEKAVRDIARDTDNLSLKAKQADERFNGLTETLARIYTAWNRSVNSQGADFAKSLGIDPKTAEYLMRATTTMDDFRAKLAEINAERGEGVYSQPIITPEELARLVKFKELDFHGMFKRDLSLDDAVQSARELGVVLEDSAIANVRELQVAFKNAQQEKKAFDDALTYDKMEVGAQRLESEIESLSRTMRTLDDGLNATVKSDPYQEIEAHVRSLDAAIENVEGDLKRTGEAMKADPSNIELAVRYYRDLQQHAELGEEKVAQLRQQLDMLDAGGASEAAKSHKDLAKWVEESAEAARVANKELSDQKATVANLQDEVQTMAQSIATIKGDLTLAEYSDGVLKWKRETEALNRELGLLESAEKRAADQHEQLGRVQGAFDKANEDVEAYRKQLDRLEEEHKQLQETYSAMYDALNGYDDGTGDLMEAYQELQRLEAQVEEVGAAYGEAQTRAAKLGDELKGQQDLTGSLDRDVKARQESVELLRKSVKALADTKEVKLFENPTDEVDKAQSALTRLQGDLVEAKAKEEELEDAYQAAKTENELAKTAQAAQDVSAEIDGTTASIKRMQNEMEGRGRSLLNASTVKSIGMTLSATITPALSAIGYKMVDASSAVDAAYRDMRKTVDGTEAQFEHLRKSAIDFSRTHVTSADQILQIEAIGGELGIATESLETFAEVISNLDVATNLDTEGAAEALGHLANIMHLSEEDYVGFSDALVRLGNNGASTETEIANIAERIGSMASIVNMSAPDVLAWASSIASTGQNAEAAGTAVSKTMSFFETAVSAAGGTMDTSMEAISAAVQKGGSDLVVFSNLMGQTAEEFAEAWSNDPEAVFEQVNEAVGDAKNSLQGIADVAHMSASDFAKAWESDPTEAMKAFIMGLNDIEKSGGSADAVLQNFGITSVRQKQAIEGLMQTIGGLDDNLRMSENAWNGISDEFGKAGDAANEAQKKAEGFSGQMQILKNMWQIFLAELGEGAAPIIKQVSGIIQGLSQWFSELDQSTKTAIVAMGGFTAALGPVLSFSSSLATGVGDFKKWYGEMTSGINLVRLAMKFGGDEISEASLKAMGSMQKLKLVGMDLGTKLLGGLKVLAIGAAIALIATELKKLYDRYQDHIAATSGLQKALSNIGEATTPAVAGIGNVGVSLGALAADSRTYESRLASLAKTIQDSNSQYGTYAGTMDYYASVVETLGSKANRTEEESNKLAAALQGINDACGTNYGLDNFGNIIDTETGKIQENTEVIEANIAARRAQALVEYYSDDYAQAVGEHADAQEKLNEAQQRYNELTGEGGLQKYIAQAKEVYGNQYDEAAVMHAYFEEVRRAEEAVKNYQSEADATSDAVDKLDAKIANANADMAKNKEVIDAAAKAQEAYDQRVSTVTADVTGNMKRLSDAVAASGQGDSAFNSIASGLESISVFANEMGNVDMSSLVSAFTSVDSSMSDVIATLEAGGVQMTTWNAALEQAPGAAENMGSVTAAAFQSMYEIAGSSIDDTMTLIAGLDTVQVNDKTFYVGDNGSIVDSQGKIYNINTDLASIPNEVITALYVNDEGARQQALDAKAALTDVGEQNPTPTISVKDNASKTAEMVQGKVDDLDNSTANPSAYLNDYASGPISYIRQALSALDGMVSTVTVKTVETKEKQATGGMNSRPVIPRNATGYIATGPTLTNQGWIGEDGVEAVANWATGGAVVPLTNKRYMLPIADAIADGMAARGYGKGGGEGVVVNLNYKAGDDANQMARDLARAIGRVQRTRR